MFECMVLCPRCDGRCLDSEIGLHDSSIGYFASRGGGHAFDRWAPSDDAEVFLAHITCCYSAEKRSLAPSTTVVSRDSGGCSSSPGCCGCWEWFVSLCGREARGKQLCDVERRRRMFQQWFREAAEDPLDVPRTLWVGGFGGAMELPKATQHSFRILPESSATELQQNPLISLWALSSELWVPSSFFGGDESDMRRLTNERRVGVGTLPSSGTLSQAGPSPWMPYAMDLSILVS